MIGLGRASPGRVGPSAALIAALALGCGVDTDRSPGEGASSAPPDSARVAAAAESIAMARDEWNTPEVVKRLTEAGLVVIDSAETARHPALHVNGRRLRVSGSELQLYVYQNADALRQDAADLDTVPASAGALVPPGERPRFIIVNNLIAILLTSSERLAERVQDALMARHLGGAGGDGEKPAR